MGDQLAEATDRLQHLSTEAFGVRHPAIDDLAVVLFAVKEAKRWRWLVAQHNTINPIAQVVWKRGSDPRGEWVNLIDGHDLIAHVDHARRASIGAGAEGDGNG